MKRVVLVAILILIIGIASFIGGGWFFSNRLLEDYNGMASDNFSTALAVFRDDYQDRRVRVFGEVEERSTFQIGDYQFIVTPTVRDSSSDSFNPGHCNIAAHLNGMVVMLACTWIVNEDPRGSDLLAKLKQVIPSYKLSAPEIETVSLVDLEDRSAMMKSVANQWSWRIGDLPEKLKAQQGGAGQPATRSESDLEGGDKPQPEAEGRSR